MRTTADAVVIGGGVVGASVLYHLTKLGLHDVVLLEKNKLCSGSSGDSAAIVRQHYSNKVSIQLAMRSIEIFQALSHCQAVNVFNQIGWIFLAPADAENSFKENMILLQNLGVDTCEISSDELASNHLPGVNLEGIARIAYEPDSGYADPVGIVDAFVNLSRNAGANAYVNTSVTGMIISGGRITGVRTTQGVINTPIVVNAAGPWAGEIASFVDLDLPLEISREQEILLRISKDSFPLQRSVSNMVDRIYFRPTSDPRNVLVGIGHPKENEPVDPNTYDRSADNGFIKDVLARVSHRMPQFADAEVIDSWSGVYTITPDWSMIVDKAPGVDGMYLAVGGSGHSFKLAPAIGKCLAEMILDRKSLTVDISPLRAGRFDERDYLRSTYGGNRG